MSFFAKKVDLRSRKAMTEFLADHYRYNTMNSWNGVSSFAHPVKFRQLGLTKAQDDKAYELLAADENYWDLLGEVLDDYRHETGYRYDIRSNGRSGGHLVMYQIERRLGDHKSMCTCCHQRNFMAVYERQFKDDISESLVRLVIDRPHFVPRVYFDMLEFKESGLTDAQQMDMVRRGQALAKSVTLHNKCGRCHAEARVNRVFHEISVFPGRGMPEACEIEYMEIEELRSLTRDVMAFDEACDRVRDAFLDILNNCEVVEEEVVTRSTVRRLACTA